ncbi:(deoxy)nucleoside triphosphate pyrophosphohydrolase [Alkalibacterium putridalgicola]|uniref:8-oxo-dGTP diphosphatase n=1 Tax=Alkalibacterium putridalgicola TaxID=426703 RepID=A0A1H7W0V5_9LACT|nr:(deoxy)nucleoside triphosphate pyrophosphohydrolase [Alkalibacterium putridalgicola]GEK88663.1 DNA mismatch repair protein MutT [Alkalibacterium putridalgicola]SEM15212.1 8-oxo-dGTP diphosphatase [Alkalibacterium putridalgicola]
MKDIYVVGAIIEYNGKILCAQRSSSMTLADLWEFPGGKIEGNETHQEALKREIKEELELDIKVDDQLFEETIYEYDFGRVHLAAYRCGYMKGTPYLSEHKAVKWLEVEELKDLQWAPADIPIVEKLMQEGVSA